MEKDMRVYSTCQRIDKKKRRRIGEMSREIKEYYNSLNTWDKVKLECQTVNQ